MARERAAAAPARGLRAPARTPCPAQRQDRAGRGPRGAGRPWLSLCLPAGLSRAAVRAGGASHADAWLAPQEAACELALCACAPLPAPAGVWQPHADLRYPACLPAADPAITRARRCGSCGDTVDMGKDDQVRCRTCGHRILYKTRLKRAVQYEAR